MSHRKEKHRIRIGIIMTKTKENVEDIKRLAD